MSAPLHVDVLVCPACGGAVPLGAGELLACPYCRAAVPLPPAQRALRDAVAGDDADRRRAQALYVRLGAPPGALTRMLAGGGFWWAVALLLPFVFAALIWIAEWITAGVERLLHVALSEVLGPARMWAFLGGIITLVVGGALVGGAYGRRRALGRRALQRLFAAKPPARAGGPASCRACGAPLAVADGALGARCAYCRADNLVAVDDAWLRGLAVDRKQVTRSLDDAAAAEQRDRRRVRRSLGARALIAALAFALLFGWGVAWPGPWRMQVVASPRTLASSETPPRVVLPIGAGAQPLALDNHCEAAGCGTALYVALRRGEQLTLRHAGQTTDPLTVIVSATSIGHRFGTTVELAKRALWRGQSIDFVAPHGGFFTVWLLTSAPLTIPVAATLR